MRKPQVVSWLSINEEEWQKRVAIHNAPPWYHDLDFLSAYLPEGGVLSLKDDSTWIPWPLRTRWGIFKEVIQPLWVQQFYVLNADNAIFSESDLIQLLKLELRVILALNVNFSIPNAQRMRNRVLTLDENGTFRRNYNSQTKRNLKMASKLIPKLLETEFEEGVQVYLSHSGNQLGINRKHWNHLKQAINQSNRLKIRSFRLEASINGKALAHLVLVEDNSRIYNLLPTTTEAGRPVAAMTTMLDLIFNTYEGSGLMFDFEGSMNQGINRFYTGFGSEEEAYTRYVGKNLFWH